MKPSHDPACAVTSLSHPRGLARFAAGAAFVLASAFTVSTPQAATTVSGVITTWNNGPPRAATVELMKLMFPKPLRAAVAGPDGRYEITVDGPGLYRIRYSAVDHEDCTVPLLIEPGTARFPIDVRMPATRLPAALDTVRIIGSWNRFDFAAASPMMRHPDGTYTFDAEATVDTLAYQLLDIVPQSSVNGTQSDGFAYDGGGDYRSLLWPRPGKVRISFDPNASGRPTADSPAEFHFADENRWAERLLYYERMMTAVDQAQMAAHMKHVEEGGTSGDFRYDRTAIGRELRQDLVAEQDPRVARFILSKIAANPDTLSLAPQVRDRVLEIMPLGCELWNDLAFSLRWFAASFPEEKRPAFWRSLLAQNPGRTVQAMALADSLRRAVREGNRESVKAVHAVLKEKYFGVSEIEGELSAYDPDRRIQPGNHVPAFEVASLDGGPTVSDQSLLGRYYLIDFWATWCGPCVRDMPHLAAAYDRFQDRRFTILSLSLDRSPDRVKAFREKSWKMPWLHGFLPGLFENELAATFEVKAIPRPLLVGPDGVILDDDVFVSLRGEELISTLEKHLGGRTPGK